jgi:inosine-uridine nucleoside N-ribohydrolase
MTHEQYEKNLQVPSGIVDAILDTDAYNETDDQFAIAYMLLSPERIRVLGLCAAPFLNSKSRSPEDGMEKSYDEILRLLDLMDRRELSVNVFRGARTYLPDEDTPVDTDAARFILAEAKKHSPEHPLYVVAIGAATNVASAILLDRETMVNNTVIVWLGGHAKDYPHTNEFNMRQDIAAARTVMGCGAPFVQLPCFGVVSHLTTTKPELTYWIKGANKLSDFLYERMIREGDKYGSGTPWNRCIWDVSAVAWLLNDGDRFLLSYTLPALIPEYDHTYSTDPLRHSQRYVYDINRDAILGDLFQKLRNLS